MPPKKQSANEGGVENARARLPRAVKKVAEVVEAKPKAAKVKKVENGETGGAKPKKGKGSKEKVTQAKEPEAKTEEAAAKPKGRKRKVEEPAPEEDKEGKNAKPLQNKATTEYENQDFSCDKKNGNGKLTNMKISSWNVDGLRAWVKKNGLEYITKEDADILCLQETKCSENKLPEELKEFKSYNMYWCSSQKEGYAGVALLSKTEPLNVEYGLDNEEFDDEGRCITAEYDDFYLVNVYVPNAGRSLVTLPKRLSWNEEFKKHIKKLDSVKPVIVCGDMNVAHKEIDLTNPTTNKKNAGFTPEERQGMTEFLEEGFVDSYRKLYPDQKDVYTFWSYMNNARTKNVGWRLDYFIVSERFMENICDNMVRSQVFGSDHCPITLFFNI